MRRILSFVAIVAWLFSVRCWAEDVVTLATGADGQGRTRATGTIVDYNGKELRLRRATGGETSVPSSRVVDIQTVWSAEQMTADKLFAEKKYAEALDQYRQAISAEKRLWVERRIVAQRVWCLQSLGRHERACVEFIRLSRADPTDQYLDAIPLAWSPIQPPLSLEREAKDLLRSERAVERLIAASWLLRVQRGEAMSELQRLTNDDDPRIAHLAAAQLWRTQIVTASPDDLANWEKQIERMPRELRAGPHLVLARALAHKKEHQRAALNFMRVSILHPRHRLLAAIALRDAAAQLEALNQRNEAISLYRELVADYAGSPQAAEAAGRLQTLTGGDNN